MDGLLDGLTEEGRRRVRSTARRRRFARGEVVFHQGDPGDTLHMIEKGRLAVRSTTRLGSVVTMAVLGPGDVFGELALLDSASRRTGTVVALDPAETLSLHRDQVQDLRREDTSVDRLLLEILRRQIVRLSDQLLDALYTPVDARVLDRLVELTEMYDDGTAPVRIRLTQEDLATMAGTTRPTANKVLRELERQGLIALRRGSTEVLDPEGLAARAGKRL